MAAVTEGSIASGVGGFTNTVGQYNTNWLECHWRRTSVSGQVSTIQWRIRFVGSGTSLQRTRISKCLLKITPVTGTINTSGTLTVLPMNSARSFEWSTIYPNGTGWAPNQGDSSYSTSWDGSNSLGGTFTVTHTNGAGKFKLQLEANIYEHTPEKWGTEVEFELPVTTTACGAPTSVVANGTVTPSGSFTVSWSGASSGVNNTISSYQVYYRVSANGAAPTTGTNTGSVNVTSTGTSGSVTITLSNATRGYKVVCGVITRGSAGSSFYSSMATGGLVTVNALPDAPILNQTTQTIASTSSGITVTATAGAANGAGQTSIIYYNTSTSHTGQTQGASVKINPSAGNSSTYYFWTYDGLEYSSSVSITITKQTKPTLTIAAVGSSGSAITTYTVNGSNGASGSDKGYAYAATPKITASRQGTLHIIPQTSDSVSGTWTDRTEFSTVQVTSTSATSLSTYNIHSIIQNAGFASTRTTKIYWRLKFYLNDGLEDTALAYFPDSGAYCISGAPTSITIYNQHASAANISGTKTGEIWNKITVSIPADTSITNSINSIKNVTVTNSYTITKTSYERSGNSDRIKLTLPDDIPGGTNLSFTLTLQTSDGAREKKFSFSAKETLKPNMGTLTYNPGTIKPFTVSQTTTSNITMPWPFTANDSATANQSAWNTILQNYNCSTTLGTAIQFIEASSNTGVNSYNCTSNLTSQSNSLSWIHDNTNLKSSLLAWKAYQFNNTLGITGNNYVGELTYYCAIKITNLFGQSFYSSWLQRKFNFNEKVTNWSYSDLRWRKSAPANDNTLYDTQEVALGDNDYVIEGVYLRFKINCKAYTSNGVTINSSLFTTKTATTNYAYTNATAARSGTQVSLIFTYLVPEITVTTGLVLSASITTSGGTVQATKTVTALRLTTPTFTFDNCNFGGSGNGSYSGTYTITDHGIDKNKSSAYNVKRWYLSDISNVQLINNVNWTSSFPTTQQSFTQASIDSNTNWTAKVVQMCINFQATLSGTSISGSNTISHSVTKTSYSNSITIYRNSPTVAYRANQVGINLGDPETYSNSILVISAATNKNLITFLNAGQEVLHIDLTQHRIY